MMKKILVTGGCGYIGSHTVVDLIENEFEVISIDNFINSSSEMLEKILTLTGKEIKNYELDICDSISLETVFKENSDIYGIIHFAALKSIPDSVIDPVGYYKNNVLGLINIIDLVKQFSIKNFIFSSSCSVYGDEVESPVTEDTKLGETQNPYSTSKKISERIIIDCFKNSEQNAIILRYFNPGGAHTSGIIGEFDKRATNLIPNLINSIGKTFKVYGGDYETKDGTCIRDYLHVMDLAEAHTKSLKYLLDKKNKENVEIFNLGTGKGTSVLESIKSFEVQTGNKINYSIVERREGDMASIFANYSKAESLLNWKPVRDIDEIMKTSWSFKNRS